VLFDLDGVLVDSTACIERTWRRWAAEQGLDAEAVMRIAHGRRALETIRSVAPHLATAAQCAALEAREAREARETDGVRDVAGAAALLAGLPAGRWAIVTSGTRAVAEHRLQVTGLPVPDVMVCADEVARGKPDPEGYLAAAQRLGVAPAACVVVEDAAAGLEAARAAGMRAVALATTHRREELGMADAVADSLSAISIEPRADGLRLVVREG
jgi:mannitol-1-/sugar-/sorbitol-6-phosphatase